MHETFNSHILNFRLIIKVDLTSVNAFVVDSLFIVAPIICGGFMFRPYFVMQY